MRVFGSRIVFFFFCSVSKAFVCNVALFVPAGSVYKENVCCVIAVPSQLTVEELVSG